MLRCCSSWRTRNWFDLLGPVILLSTSSVNLTSCDAGIDLDSALVSACNFSAAALAHAHLLNFFAADILEVDTLAAVDEFAGPHCNVVIVMYLKQLYPQNLFSL